MENELIEEWRDIPGHLYYQASNLGQIRSLPRMIRHNEHSKPFLKQGRVLCPIAKDNGYRVVCLNRSEGHSYIHRLVLQAFCPAENADHLEVNHIDGNKSNNVLSNLEWCTKAENMQHSYRLGMNKRGDNHVQMKVTFAEVQQIRALREDKEHHYSQRELAEMFHLSRGHVQRICNYEKRVFA